MQVGVLQLICNYISMEWKGKLSREVGMTNADWMGKKKPKYTTAADGKETDLSGKKRSRACWEAVAKQEDANALPKCTI